MAHNLHRNRMAFVGQVPWHGLGKEVPPTVTAEQMCRAAGLDWEVYKVPAPGARLVNVKCGLYDRNLILRDPIDREQEPVALGMVGSSYEPLQNTEAFKFFEPFIDNKYAQFHTAGALGNGERVWVLAKLNDAIVIRPDDVVDRFLLLSNSHDGTGAVSIRFTPIRVVCQNTLNYAMKKSSGVISVRHTRHIARNLEDAQAEELKRIVDKAFEEAETLFGSMSLKNISTKDIDAILEALFPRTENQKKIKSEPERWTRIKSILEDQKVTPYSTRGSLWALYNAITRDEDYRMSREASADARLERVWFGAGHDLKIKALAFCRDYLSKAA
ncbi:MAG TPA: DUF932 domain-containing protein [Burkholderiales bacterium]|nr:DUF932 domain-containing protein [Burkholderiales bacterium]